MMQELKVASVNKSVNKSLDNWSEFDFQYSEAGDQRDFNNDAAKTKEKDMQANTNYKTSKTVVMKETLITRADFMNHIKIPKSNPSRIIIPSNPLGNSFRRDSYNSEFLGNLIDEDEFKEIVMQISKISQQCYSQKRLLDNSKISNNVSILYALAFVFVFAFTFLFYYGSVNRSRVKLWAAMSCLIIAFIIVAAVLFKHFFIDYKDYIPNFEMMVKKSLDEYFYKINKFYVQRGLWWRAVPGHYWIELRIDQSLKEEIMRNQEPAQWMRDVTGTVQVKVHQPNESNLNLQFQHQSQNDMNSIEPVSGSMIDSKKYGQTKTEPQTNSRRRTQFIYQQYIEDSDKDQRQTIILNKGRRNSQLVYAGINTQERIAKNNVYGISRNEMLIPVVQNLYSHNLYQHSQGDESRINNPLEDTSQNLLLQLNMNPLEQHDFRTYMLSPSNANDAQDLPQQKQLLIKPDRRKSNFDTMINNPMLQESSLPDDPQENLETLSGKYTINSNRHEHQKSHRGLAGLSLQPTMNPNTKVPSKFKQSLNQNDLKLQEQSNLLTFEPYLQQQNNYNNPLYLDLQQESSRPSRQHSPRGSVQVNLNNGENQAFKQQIAATNNKIVKSYTKDNHIESVEDEFKQQNKQKNEQDSYQKQEWQQSNSHNESKFQDKEDLV
eukprot:403337231